MSCLAGSLQSLSIITLPSACVNLCRDEITNILRVKLESVFPLVFNINGLGAGLTCGVTGLKAGLSHSPECSVRCLKCRNSLLDLDLRGRYSCGFTLNGSLYRMVNSWPGLF